jgi:hypothetical protein
MILWLFIKMGKEDILCRPKKAIQILIEQK